MAKISVEFPKGVYYWMKVKLTTNDDVTVDIELVGTSVKLVGVDFDRYQRFDQSILWYSHYNEFPAHHKESSARKVVVRPEVKGVTVPGWLLMNSKNDDVSTAINELGGTAQMGNKWPLWEA